MALISIKTVSVHSGVAHESIDNVEVNKDNIVMVKKVYYPIEKEVEEEGETKKVLQNETFYKVSFSNGEALVMTETEKNKLN